MANPGKRIARVKLTLTKRAVDALQPGDRPWTAWDDKIVGFGVRVQPSGVKSFLVNYRAGDGGRRAPNKRFVIGRHGRMPVDQARRKAREVLGEVAGGGDPADDRARARAMPTLEQAFEDYMKANPKLAPATVEIYRTDFRLRLGSLRARRLDKIERRDVEELFNRISAECGWSLTNRSIKLLRSIYRRFCIDIEGLRNPVELWMAGGGKYHPKKRRRISSPSEVLPCWRAGIEAEVPTPAARDALWFGLYTGMRIGEVLTLRWERVDMAKRLFRVDETKTGVPLELPVTRQLAAILERRRAAGGGASEGWVFPSRVSRSGRVAELSHMYEAIGRTGGAKFWFHGLRNCFITVAERELLLPLSLTKRLVNHARPSDVTEGYAADWTIEQLREPAQRIADRIEAMMNAEPAGAPPGGEAEAPGAQAAG